MIYSRNTYHPAILSAYLKIIILASLLSSCSFFDYKRSPAATGVVQTQEEVLQVLEFDSSGISDKGKDYRKTILDYIDNTVLFQGTYGVGNEVSVEFVEDTTLPKHVAYWPQFQAKNNSYKILVLHSKEAITDPVASAELVSFLRTIRAEKYFAGHFAAFEMYYNTMEQDALAAQNWAKVRVASAAAYPVSDFDEPRIVDGLKQRAESWTKEQEDYSEKAEQALKLQRKLDKERRAVIDALDKASDDEQFKNLVAKNDRKGAAALLKKYLPWEQMAPFEKKYWETYLEVLKNPLPMEERIFVYRGIDDDYIYSAYKDGVELEKEIAQKEGNVFVMSTILTKNQGTWNRRLRSLTAMNEKFIGTNSDGSDEFSKSARIMTMFVNHSRDPKGSPFLSLTPKYGVARDFGAEKISAYALDPRLMSFNFASKYTNEVEFLIPLVVFPDEFVAFIDRKIHPDMDYSEEQLKALFKEKLISKFGTAKAEETYQKVMANSQEYFDSALNRYQGKKTAAVKKEPNFLVKFFTNLFSKKEEVKVEKTAVKGSACMDIISSFWK